MDEKLEELIRIDYSMQCMNRVFIGYLADKGDISGEDECDYVCRQLSRASELFIILHEQLVDIIFEKLSAKKNEPSPQIC